MDQDDLEALRIAQSANPTPPPDVPTPGMAHLDDEDQQALAIAQKAAPLQPDPTLPPPTTLDKIGMGLEHGTLSVPKTLGYAGADYLAEKLGADPKNIEAQQTKRAAEEAAYQRRFGGSTIAATAAIPGQVLAAAPYMMGGEAALGLGASAAPAVAAPVADIVGTNMVTRAASRGIVGASQGAGFNALTGQDINTGGETGAAINGIAGPVAGKVLGGIANKISDIAQPFTESGRTDIANKIIQGYAENPLNINARELVKGSSPTLAEATGNPGIAQLQDTLRDNNSKQFTDRQIANNDARNNALTDAAGTPQDIQAAAAQRAANAKTALGDPANGIPSQLFATAKPVETSDVLDTIDKITNGKSGQRPAVSQSMDAVKKMLTDSKGNPITDPETLYHSVRKGIGDLMDKKNLSNPAGQQASAELGQVKDALDNVIEKGAPGFKQYLNDYSQASSPIDAMKWMQGLNIKNAQGDITLSGVQNALKNANKLQNTPGSNAAKNLSSDQIDTLQNIRDDMLRQGNLTLGKSYGSPTIQKATAQNKLNNVLSGSNYHLFSGVRPPLEAYAAGAGAGVAHYLGLPSDIGATAGAGIAAAGKKVMASKNDLVRQKLQDIMLNPQSYVPLTAANTAGTNMLDNPLLKYGMVPAGNSIFNALHQ